jgi:hypothetical protein
MHSTSRFFTVRQWTEQKHWPPLGGLRHLIFHAKSNGFDAVIRRVGRRILLSEAAFESWIERNGAHADLDSPRAAPRTSSDRGA